LDQISPFNKPCHSQIHPPFIKRNTSLQWLSTYLQEGYQPCNSRIKVSPPASVIPVCEDILHELMKRGNLADVYVPSIDHRLREIDGSVEISIGAECTESPRLTLPNTSLRKVQQNLINNLIIRSKNGVLSTDATHFFLNQTMTNLESNPEEFTQCPQFYAEVVVYIFNLPRINTELMFLAVTHIIKYVETYTLKFASKAVQIALQHAGNCSSKNSAASAQYIIEPSQITHCHGSKMSAVFYIVFQAYIFPPRIFTLAANHFVNNIEDYPKGFSTTAATKFIEQNTRFFKELFNEQKNFIDFYTSRGEMFALQDYSDKLTELLKSDDRKFLVDVVDQSLDEPLTTETTVLGLWLWGHFEEPLKNETISMFILKNTAHDAITLWNDRDKPPRMT